MLRASNALHELVSDYEEKCHLDPGFLRRLPDLELEILWAVIVICSTDILFSAFPRALEPRDSFEMNRLKRLSEALVLLIDAGYVSHKVAPSAEIKDLAIHPEAERLILAECERRENLWSAPASTSAPRQRPSLLAERELAR